VIRVNGPEAVARRCTSAALRDLRPPIQFTCSIRQRTAVTAASRLSLPTICSNMPSERRSADEDHIHDGATLQLRRCEQLPVYPLHRRSQQQIDGD